MYEYIRIKRALRARAETYEAIAWDYITKLYYGIILQDNITGAYYGIILPDNMAE